MQTGDIGLLLSFPYRHNNSVHIFVLSKHSRSLVSWCRFAFLGFVPSSCSFSSRQTRSDLTVHKAKEEKPHFVFWCWWVILRFSAITFWFSDCRTNKDELVSWPDWALTHVWILFLTEDKKYMTQTLWYTVFYKWSSKCVLMILVHCGLEATGLVVPHYIIISIPF